MIYDAQIPKEPVKGTVVIDRDKVAWQRQDDIIGAWRRSATNGVTTALNWNHLIAGLGPLTLVYTPESK